MTTDKLFDTLDTLKATQSKERDAIECKIQAALNTVYDDWKALQSSLVALESSNEYMGMEDGIYQWVRFDLSDVPKRERHYLDNYLEHVVADFENDTLQSYQGDDYIGIQDDSYRDNGVYCGHKMIYSPDDYCDPDRDDDKRDYLIEQYMEKTGCFPGVFRITRNGDVFPVSTQEGAKRYAMVLKHTISTGEPITLTWECVDGMFIIRVDGIDYGVIDYVDDPESVDLDKVEYWVRETYYPDDYKSSQYVAPRLKLKEFTK